MTDPQHEETFADTERKLREIITTLRAQLAEAHKDGFQLAAWQCLFDDGKTGIVCDDWGNQYCAMQRRADRAEQRVATLEHEVRLREAALSIANATLAAQIEKGEIK